MSLTTKIREYRARDKLSQEELAQKGGAAMLEALSQVEDEEKRVVGIIAKRKGMFVSLQFYNYCPQPPQFSGGLPVTTKTDKQYHGFGMKSIRMIAQKYGGEMDVSVENQVFNLRLLFPLE